MKRFLTSGLEKKKFLKKKNASIKELICFGAVKSQTCKCIQKENQHKNGNIKK